MPIDVPPGRPEGGLDPTNRIKVTGAGPLVVLGLIGLAVGWGARWEAIQVGSPAPSVGWLITAVTWFIVAVTTMIAYLTRRTVAIAPASLTPQQGLFRLVLGKTIARLGAFGLGGFGGIVISRLGVSGEHVGEVITRALVAALGAAAGIAAGLLLEHACRVPPGGHADLP
jgi:hypothetical protein